MAQCRACPLVECFASALRGLCYGPATHKHYYATHKHYYYVVLYYLVYYLAQLIHDPIYLV